MIPAVPRPEPATRSRPGPKQIAGLVLAVLFVLFMVQNLERVSVDWLIGSWETPLIVVIAVSALLGAGADRLLQARSRRRERARRD